MIIEPILGEPTRYFVKSETREDVFHIVDMDDDGKPNCSCEDSMTRHRVCKHIRAVKEHLLHPSHIVVNGKIVAVQSIVDQMRDDFEDRHL